MTGGRFLDVRGLFGSAEGEARASRRRSSISIDECQTDEPDSQEDGVGQLASQEAASARNPSTMPLTLSKAETLRLHSRLSTQVSWAERYRTCLRKR